MICGRDTAALGEVERTIGAIDRAGRCVPVEVDSDAEAAAVAIVDECVNVFGRLDILINNAGGTSAQRLSDMSSDDWQAAFDRNFFSAARLAVAAANVMRRARLGSPRARLVDRRHRGRQVVRGVLGGEGGHAQHVEVALAGVRA